MNPTARSRQALAALIMFGAGATIMVLFDHPATLAAGLALMIGFVAMGVVLICRPGFLDRDAG